MASTVGWALSVPLHHQGRCLECSTSSSGSMSGQELKIDTRNSLLATARDLRSSYAAHNCTGKLKTSFVGQKLTITPSADHQIRPQLVSRRSLVKAKHVNFEARKSVSISCKETSFSVDEYLADTDRVVNVAFPDSSRLQYLGKQVWRAKLRPVAFFTISATPVCDLRSWFEDGALRIFSDRVVLDLAGLPPQFHDINLRLNLDGRLFATQTDVAQTLTHAQNCTLEGWVNMSLKLDLPMPFSFMPDLMVKQVGDAILDGILSAMQGALMRGLVRDYSLWARERAVLKARQEEQISRRPQSRASPAGQPAVLEKVRRY